MKLYLFPILLSLLGILACKEPDNSNKQNPNPQSEASDSITNKVEDEKVNRNEFLISDNQAGPFKIGDELPGPSTMMKYKMRVEQKTRDTDEGPQTESVTIISDQKEDLLWLKSRPADNADEINKIWEINVISPKYKTSENIGIGSTITEFQTAYPDYKLWFTYVSSMYVIESEKIKVQFILDPNDFIGSKPVIESEKTSLKISDFKNTATIKSVRII